MNFTSLWFICLKRGNIGKKEEIFCKLRFYYSVCPKFLSNSSLKFRLNSSSVLSEQHLLIIIATIPTFYQVPAIF